MVVEAVRAKRLVLVLLVVEELVATKLVEVEKMKLADDAKRLVEEAVVEKKVEEVALVNTVEEAIKVPLVAKIPTAER